MSTLIVDNTHFDYPASAHPRTGRCHLRAFHQGSGDVVLLVTDLGHANPGASVTNAIEVIVTAAVRRYTLDPTRLTVVQHYDDRWTRGANGTRRRCTALELALLVGREEGESFDIVTFARVPTARTASVGAADPHEASSMDADPLSGDEFGGPTWRRISKRRAEALIGQPLP